MKLRNQTLVVSLFAATMTVSAPSSAGLDDMQQFFDDIGMYSNSTASGVFRGQTRNYMTGGGLTVRIPNKTYQVASFDPPRLSASCGGIDAFSGSFSFLNSDQLVQMLQNIGNNAAGAVFQLALESVSPQLSSIMKYFQDMANKINALNVNSCQAAKGIVRATANQSLKGTYLQNMMEMGKDVLGTASDFSGMKEAFQSDKNEIRSAENNLTGSGSPLTEDQKDLIAPGNILWKALDRLTSSGSGLSDDEKLLIMATVGTVIIEDDPNDGTKVGIDVPPTLDNPLKAYTGANNSGAPTEQVAIPVHSCNNMSECDSISGASTTITVSTLRKIVHDRIKTARDKIMSRTGGLTAADFELVNMSYLPIWTMLENEYRTDGVLNQLDTSEEIIALDYTKALLDQTFKGVSEALYAFRSASNPGIDEHIEKLRENIRDVRRQVDREWMDSKTKFNAYMTSMQALQLQSDRVRTGVAQQLAQINSRRQ
jgi:conjugative transfer pilus assembly protein TraH